MSSDNPKNILVVRTDRIGDVVLTLPTIHALRQRFFEAKITLLVTPMIRDMIVGHPEIDQVMVDDRDGRHYGMIGFYRLIQDLRAQHFDTALIFHTKKRTNLACAWARIPRRIGYKNEKYGSLLTEPLFDERHCGKQHEAQYCLDTLNVFGVESHELTAQLPVQGYARSMIKEWLMKEGVYDERLIVLHPGSSCPTKCWPIKSFAELAKKILDDHGLKVIVMGDHGCREAARQIKRYAGRDVLDVTGNLTLPQMVALLDRAQVLISNDSGPVHVASAVNTPVISLFLRNQPGINPERWRPLGDKAITLMNKPGEEIALNDQGDVVAGKFDSITVDEVFEAVKQLI